MVTNRTRAQKRISVFVMMMILFTAGCAKENEDWERGGNSLFRTDNNQYQMDVWDWRADAPTYSFFSNANQWHYNLSQEMDPAGIIIHDTKEKNQEIEPWELRRMYTRWNENTYVSTAFVKSESGRELYLYIEEMEKYLVIADIIKGNGLKNTLGDNEYSYDSSLPWRSYRKKLRKDREDSGYSIEDEWAYLYDDIYIEEGALAIEDFLKEHKADKKEKWELVNNKVYIGVNGYLADLWYSNGAQRVHIVIDVWNKKYAVVEVFDEISQNTGEKWGKFEDLTQSTGEEWRKFENLADMSGDYFTNASEWHFKEEFERKAACAVENYSRQTGLEEEWELTHMYGAGGIISVFARSRTYRELLLLLKEDAWLLIADVQSGGELENKLMDHSWSYHSEVDWCSYREWAYEEQEFSYKVTSAPEYDQYDSIYAFQADCAMQAYLSSAHAEKTIPWEILYENFFVSSQGCLVDVWYSDKKQKVHLVIDVWNKLYTVIDVV